jgi:hypothetical protein
MLLFDANDILMIHRFDDRFMDDASTFSSTSQPSRGKGREYKSEWLIWKLRLGVPVLASLGGEPDQLFEIKKRGQGPGVFLGMRLQGINC